MANVNEVEKWEPGIYQLETTDPVMGGEDGIDNLQARQLANRTAYLKKQIDETKKSIPKIPEIPVKSVNGKKGDVKITATDVSALTKTDAEKMFLPARINDKSPTYEVGVVTDYKTGLKSGGGDVITTRNISKYALGVNQKWFDVTNQRVINVIYTNTTGKPIFIHVVVWLLNSESAVSATLFVDDVRIKFGGGGFSHDGAWKMDNVNIIVPANSTYKLESSGTIYNWVELR